MNRLEGIVIQKARGKEREKRVEVVESMDSLQRVICPGIKIPQYYIYLIFIPFLIILVMTGCGNKESKKDNFFKKGKNYLKQSDYARARVEFKNIVNLDPNSSQGFYFLGLCNYHLKQWDIAGFSFAKAEELDPDDIPTRLKRGELYLMARNYEESMKRADLVLDKQPDHVEALGLKAAVLAAQNRFDKAIPHLKKGIRINPGYIDNYIILAKILNKQGQSGKAIIVLKGGLEQDKNNALLLLTLADIQVREKSYGQAEVLYRELVKLNPNQIGFQKILIDFLSQQGKLNEVEEIIKKVLADDPKQIDFQLRLAELYLRRNVPEEAIKILNQYLKKYPDEGPDQYKIMNVLAKVYLGQKKYDQVLGIVDEILKKNPNDLEAHFNRGKTFLAKREGNKAIDEFRKVLKEKPDYVEASYHLALGHLLNREEYLYRDTLEKTLTLDEDYKPARFALVDFYLSTHNDELAIKELEILLKRDPENSLGHYKFGLILAQKGKSIEAIKEFEHCLSLNPNSIDALRKMAYLYISQIGLDQTLKRCENYLSSFKSPAVVYNLMAELSLKNKDKDYFQAIRYYNQALEHDPDFIPAANNLAFCYAEYYGDHKDMMNKAIILAQKLRQRVPDDPGFADTLGWVYYQMGDYDRAMEEISEAIEKIPEHPEVCYHYGMVQYKKGNFKSARESLGKAINQSKKKKVDFEWVKKAMDVYTQIPSGK